MTDRVTAFLITCGETTTAAARAALEAQSHPCRLDVVDHVAPMDRAFQAMLDRCGTELFVQVDADMILEPDAVARLVEWVDVHRPSAAMVCAPLWDAFERRPLYGVKVYRHAVFRQFPYRPAYSCEVDQLARLLAAGHRWSAVPLAPREGCFGLHGTAYTPEQAFKRWKRLVVKQRRSVEAHPPHGQLLWTEAYYQRHLAWYLEDRDPARLAAVLGMAAGLAGPIPEPREDDYRETDPDWERVRERWFTDRTLPVWVTDWRAE